MSKKILIIFPDSKGNDAITNFFAPTLGVIRIVSYLNNYNHEADYFDPNLFAVSHKGLSLEEKILEKEWDYIGFSTLDDTLFNDIQNMYLAHKLHPEAIIVAGGVEAQFNYQTILDKSPCRIVISGEGEAPFRMLADDVPWQNIPGIIVKNLAKPMNQELFNEATCGIEWEKLPYEDYWNVYKKIYGNKWNSDIEKQVNTVRIFSRNRCPIGCKFCSSTAQLTLASGGKVPVISTTESNLISVVDRIVASHPEVKQIYLTDDDFMINKRSVIRFCKLVVERNYKNLYFMSFSRITDLNEEVISWLKKANWRMLNIGVESFSNSVLNEFGKRCDAARIEPTLDLVIKAGIKPHMSVILTSPESTLNDVELTLKKSIKYFSTGNVQGAVLAAIYPLKGTEFYEKYTNFKSCILNIPGTNFSIKKDEYVYANDPCVREFQKRYYEESSTKVNKYIRDNDVRHPGSAKLALISCKVGLEMVKQIRDEFTKGKFNHSERKQDKDFVRLFQGLGSSAFYEEGMRIKENLRRSFAKDKLKFEKKDVSPLDKL